MQKLGIGAYRFSVAWPRVMPDGRGAVNEAGLAFYDRLIDSLIASGIEPWLCLYHWDLPQALQDSGGWANRDCAQWFADYTDVIARRYGDRVKRFATFNEPSVFTLFGYCLGGQAPGIVDRAMLLRAIHHVNLGHGAAVDRLRAAVAGASLGAVHNCQPCRPATDKPEDRAASDVLDAYWNGAFPDPQLRGFYPPLLAEAMTPYVKPGDLAQISRPVDWFGLNHYSLHYVVASDRNPLGLWFGGAERRGARRVAHCLSQGLYRRDVRRDRGRRRRARLFRLVTARQFRMGLGLQPALRAGLYGLSDAAPAAQGFISLVCDVIKAHSASSVPTV